MTLSVNVKLGGGCWERKEKEHCRRDWGWDGGHGWCDEKDDWDHKECWDWKPSC